MENKEIDASKKEIKRISNKFLFFHSLKETSRRKGYFIICFFACFLVCLVSLISKTVLNQGPIVFLMLAELNAGEVDIVIKSQPMPNYGFENSNNMIDAYRFYYAFLNYTKLVEIFNSIEGNESHSDLGKSSTPRLSFFSSIGNCRGCEDAMVDFQLIDTIQEKEIELGRSYPFSKMSKGQCILSKFLAEKRNYIIGQTVFLETNFDILLRNILISTYYDNYTHPYNENITFIEKVPTILSYPCKIINLLDQNYGKTAHDNNKLFLMEQEYFFQHISENLNNETLSMFPDFPMILKNLKISDYANSVILNFPNPRIDSYLVSNMDDLQYKGVSFANKIIETLGEDGRDNLKLDMPVIEKMKPLFYGSIFLGLILNIIIIILFILSLILIHSLLVITTETNTFQLGLLRMLGTTKSGVIKIIIFQCISFSIPACILAYSVHFYVLDGISMILSKFTDNSTHLSQNFNSVIFSFIVCNLAPLIAAILPIKSLLNKNLAFTISSSSSKSTGVHIEIISAGERERSTLVTFGILTFLYGASIYYFLPLSLLSINLTLLLAIFLWILLGMLLGFIVLSLNVENILQKIFTYVFLFWTKYHTKIMVIKNLTTHRIRNRQTSMMYALSVGFFIMITVGLDIELKSLTLTQLLKRGSYAHLERGGEYYIKPEEIKNSLKLMLEKQYILDYSFISANLRDVCFSSENTFMNIGKSMDFKVDVVSVSPNFYEVAEKAFLIVEQQKIENNENLQKMKNWPISEKMYHSSNEGRIGVSGIFSWEIALNVEDIFYLNTMKDSNVMPLIFKPCFILHSSPALQMSAVPSTFYQRSFVLPINIYLDILNKCWAYFIKSPKDIKTFSYEEFPIDRILLKLNPNINSQIATKGIQQIIEDDPNYLVRSWYYSDQEKNINKISSICTVIFYGVSIIVLIFCFFNLTASMTINIYEQKKEIAILRSLGMTANHILFVYVCESFILIFVSSFIGLIIGSIISWTMTMQRIIFTNLPLHFNFPYGQLIFIFITSTISGFLSTIVPARGMLRNSISNLIRN